MEYIQSKPNNIDVYVNEFHTRIKTEFEKSINKIYNEELSVYRQVIETVVKLPFIQEIIEENKTLKAKLKKLEEADNVVKLEIFDKPVSKTVLDVETIPFSTTVSSEANSGANSDDDADDESSGDDDESSDEDDKPIASKVDKEETKHSEEANDEQSDAEADEDDEEEQSADEEDQSPTFPVKIIVNKLDKEEDNLEEVEEEEEEEESADQEEVETETEEVEESEEEDEANDEPSADQEEEEANDEPSADEADAEVIEIEIDGKTYYCESEDNGNIYEDDNGEVGNIVGEIKDGEASFFE
jgi:hypothetical protein